MGLTSSEAQLMQALEANADAYDNFFDDADNADSPVVSQRSSQGVRLTRAKGNPTFSAQFDIAATIKYFTLTAAVYTQITPAALNGALKVALPVFIFGWNDFKAGFTKLKNQFPINSWLYGRPFIYGSTAPDASLAFDATILAQLQLGDMVMPFTSALPGTGTTTLALVIVRCSQVAYGTLLESLVSDKFVMNMIRYVVQDETSPSLAQYANNIGIFKQSLFGKFNSDFVSPNSFKVPTQLSKNLIDIPLKKGIDKQIALATYLNFDATTFNWSTFVWTVKKN